MTQLPAAFAGNKSENFTSHLLHDPTLSFFVQSLFSFFLFLFFPPLLSLVHTFTRFSPSLEVKATHQSPSLLWNSTDVHRMTLYDAEKASLGDSNSTDYMDPPGERKRETNQSLPSFELNTPEGS